MAAVNFSKHLEIIDKEVVKCIDYILQNIKKNTA